MGYVEVEEFVIRDGVDDASFARLDADLQVWAYRNRVGLRRRTTARDGRRALVITLFEGAAAPAEGDAGAEPVAAFAAAIDHTTYRRAVYRDLDGAG